MYRIDRWYSLYISGSVAILWLIGLLLLGSGVVHADSSTSVSAGWTHTLSVDSTGRVWVLGANDTGQLGDGSTEISRWPVVAAYDPLLPVQRLSVPSNPLAGTDWELSSDPIITLSFGDNGFSGFAGCNGYFGEYQLTSDNGIGKSVV